MEKKEQLKLSLDEYRNHCARAMATPMVDMIDRIETLSKILETVLPDLHPDMQPQVRKILDASGFGAPIR